MEEIKSLLHALLEGQEELKAQMDGFSIRLARVEGEIASIKQEIAEIKEDLAELKLIVNGHSVEIADMKERMATKEDIARLELSISYLTDKVIEHDKEIYALKRAKSV